MYLSEIKLWNFRKYGKQTSFDINTPDLVLPLRKGMNVLVGENDSGKSAIIDAIKLVLKTQDYEWIRVSENDFFKSANRFRIELRFDELRDEEAKNFIEWLCYRKNDKNQQELYLRLIYDVTKNDDRIFPSDICAGADENGYPLTAEAKDYLKATYLKPLRDAAAELTPGKYSRLSNILYSSDTFKKGLKENTLTAKIKEFNEFVKEFFEKSESEGNEIKVVIDEFLNSFIENQTKSEFSFAQKDLRTILSKLELGLSEVINPGLGSLNRLYMAAELLNLKRNFWNGVKLCLVEELEAHLHPQAQMKVISKLQQCAEKDGIQFLLTTHSPNLTSKLPLESLIYCHNKSCYPMGKQYTNLEDDDYVFLEKFLDVTKANLFFAKGLIFVEGWAEEILLPAFAQMLKSVGIISQNLTEAGVSIINVGNLSFLRYSKIFQRKTGDEIGIPIAIITDSDVRLYEKKATDISTLIKVDDNVIQIELRNVIEELEEEYNYQNSIKVFIAKDWTLEFALYKSKILNATLEKIITALYPKTDFSNFEQKLAEKLINQNLKKTEIAYQLSECLKNIECTKEQIDSDISIQYLVEAVKFVCN